MRLLEVFGTASAAILVAGFASAAPGVQIRGAAARVIVIPEARRDVAVTIVRAVRKLPLKVRTFNGTVFINGDIGHRSHGCLTANGLRTVGIWGRGAVAYKDLPQIVIRTPMDVRISAGEAVFGDVGRSHSLDLTNQGCGAWTIANVAERLRVDQAGSGDARAGDAGTAELSVAGSGNVSIQTIRGGGTAVSSGSGDITVASLSGPLDARIAGSGDIRVLAGRISHMTASVAGSGDVSFGGTAQSLNASIAGSGGVRVARVNGSVTKQVFGSGEVRVGR